MELYDKAKLIVGYLNDNDDAFNTLEKNTIINNCIMNNDDGNYTLPSVVSQVYDELNLLPDDRNIYKEFLKLLDSEFKIKDKNIIEIGGGNIPRLAIRIASMQEKGTITVYDPNLYMKNYLYNNLKLKKEKFSTLTNTKNIDILIGLMPCGATDKIVKSAIKNNKDFMIALCDHYNTSSNFDECDDDFEWRENLICRLREEIENNNMGVLKVKKIKAIGSNPIIYNHRG